MNPRTKFEDADPTTVRAFVELFNRAGDTFRFPVDNRGDDADERELRATLTPSDNVERDGESTFTVVAINMLDEFDEVRSVIDDLGVTVVDEERTTKTHEDIGEYEVATVTAYAPTDIDAEWNKPTMLFYGSLTPELEEQVNAAFGTAIEAMNLRNHVAIRGDSISDDDRITLADRVTPSNGFFDDDARFISSNISTGTVA